MYRHRSPSYDQWFGYESNDDSIERDSTYSSIGDTRYSSDASFDVSDAVSVLSDVNEDYLDLPAVYGDPSVYPIVTNYGIPHEYRYQENIYGGLAYYPPDPPVPAPAPAPHIYQDYAPYYHVPSLRNMPEHFYEFLGFHGFITTTHAQRVIADAGGGHLFGVVVNGEIDETFDVLMFHQNGTINIGYNYTHVWITGSPQFLWLSELHQWIRQNENEMFNGINLGSLIKRSDDRLSLRYDVSMAEGFYGVINLSNDKHVKDFAFFKFAMPSPIKYTKLFNEVYTLSKIRHKNIVKVIGLGIEFVCIWQEFLGYSMFYHFHHHPEIFKPTFIDVVVKTIADVLVFLKSKDLVHRNIEPDTVFLTCKGIIKLSGFGCSEFQKPVIPKFAKYLPFISSWFRTNAVIADSELELEWQYQAPESLTKGEFSFQSDVYQFALFAYSMFTSGKTPFSFCPEEVNHLTKIAVVSTGTTWISYPKNINEELREMFMKCISFKPSARPSIEIVRNTLNQVQFS